MGEFRDTLAKRIIREQWCKPLIKYVHDKLKYKLLYLGLPGPQALDLDNWIEYFDEIIAFQCRDYPNPSSIRQNNADVLGLNNKLREFERRGKIRTYSLYDGYIEEVILRGKDVSGNIFSQNDVVTVYNLDFCNSITQPLKVNEENGNVRDYYKTEVIRRLLEFQREISTNGKIKKFVMFFTVHTNFLHGEGTRYIAQTRDRDLKRYFYAIRGLRFREKNVRLLRAYIFHIIREFFCNCEFTPEFLPAIFYQGYGSAHENWLIHQTIIGALNKQKSARAPHFQDTNIFLNRCFLTPRDGKLDNLKLGIINENECRVDSVQSFSESECFQRLWR